jgi:hypothetical protein
METDELGNVDRELTAENRLRALAEGSGSVAKSEQLDTQFNYSLRALWVETPVMVRLHSAA